MKKMQKLAFLCLLSCPLSLFAVQPNQPNYPNAQLNVANVTQSIVPADQDLSINGDMLGLKGPLSLSTIYSKTFGLILEGKYTQLLNSTNALAVELDGGKAERRIGATWGHILTFNQRIKLTAENLSQKRDFDFDSGNVSKWVNQAAVGGSYEYLLPYKLIKDLNLNAYYSKSHSKDLGYKDFTHSGIIWKNYRRIAGATDKSASAGIDLSPLQSTLVGLQLNYDKIKYDMHYQQAPNQNDSGMGATISLHQLVNKRLQFSLLAGDRKPYKDYQGEVDWLLNSVPGSQLQLSLVGERIDANFGLPNDNRIGLQLSYSWGGSGTSSPMTFSDPMPDNSGAGLKDWTNTPAVHMAQVLAVKDQKTERLGTSSHILPARGSNDSSDFYYNKEAYHDLPITPDPIKIGDKVDLKYGDQSDQTKCPPLFINKNLGLYDMKISYSGLPQSGDLKVKVQPWTNPRQGNNFIEVSGTPTVADFTENPDHCIDITIKATRTGGTIETAIATIKLKPAITSPTINLHTTSYVVNAGQSIDHFDLAKVTANQGTVDPSTIKLDPDLTSHGIILDPAYKTDCAGKSSCEIYLKSDRVINPVTKMAVTLNAKNTLGGSASAPFDVTIDAAKQPTIEMHTTSYVVNAGQSIDHFDLAKITANEGTVNPDAVKLDPDLTSHGITLDASACQGKESCEVYFNADKVINHIAKTTIKLNADNTGGGSANASFDITINSAKPTITMHTTSYVAYVGQSIDHFDLAKITANEGAVNPDTIKLNPDLTSHGITLDTSACQGKESCEVYFNANKVTTPADKTTIKLNAGNTAGGSTDASFDVTIDSTKKPTITMHTTSYVKTEGDAVDLDLATITANQGMVNPDTIKLVPGLDQHGINLDSAYKTDCANKTSCEIYLKGTATGPTFYLPEVIVLNAGNTAGGNNKGLFSVSIRGVPVVTKSDLGSAQALQGQKTTLVSKLSDNFKNPIESGKLTFQFKDNQGSDIQSKYGLSVDAHGNLIADVPLDAPVGKVDIYVWANNDIGTAKSSAIYHLDVVDNKPQITHDNDATFHVKDSGVTSAAVVTITTKYGELDPDGIHVTPDAGQQTLAHYNLKVADPEFSADHKTATIKITTDGAVQNAGTSSYTVTAANKGGDPVSLNHAFAVNVVNSVPIIKTTNLSYKIGTMPGDQVSATIDVGEGEILADKVQIWASGGMGYAPSAFALKFNVLKSPSKQHDEIHVVADTRVSPTVITPEPGSQKCGQTYEIDVQTQDGIKAKGYFTITVSK